jgi:hypothetical protein
MLALVVGIVGAGLLSAVAVTVLSELVGFTRTLAFVVPGVISYVCLTAAVWWFCLRRHGAPWSAIGVRNPGIGPIAIMAPLTLGMLVANGILLLAMSLIFGGIENPQTDALAPRGVLTTENYIAHRGVAFGIALSAALFAVAHVIPVLLPSLLLLGVVLALVVERYASLVPAIALHALNNGLSLTLLYAASSRA